MARTSTLDSEIRSRIDSFLAQIVALIRRGALDSVREALGDDTASAPTRRGPGRPPRAQAAAASTPRARRRRGRRGKRTSEEVDALAERLLSYVRENPGQGAEAIAQGMGISTKELKLPVIKLLGSKSLKTTGQRRGTKYFPAGGRSVAARKPSLNGRRKKAKRKARKAA